MAGKSTTHQTKKKHTQPAKKTYKKNHKKENGVGEEMRKQGQSWSIDVIIGVIIFVLVIAIFYAVLSSDSEGGIESLQTDRENALTKIGIGDNSEKLNLFDNGIINQSQYNQICDNYDYEQVKSILGIENDFCIFLEDEEGEIIPCGTGASKTWGIGNGKSYYLTPTIFCGETV